MATIYSQYLDFPAATGTITIEPIQPFTTAHITLAGNITIATVDLDDGELLSIMVTQDATGGRTITWGSEFKFAGGVTPVISSAPNSVDTFLFIVEGGNLLTLPAIDVK